MTFHPPLPLTVFLLALGASACGQSANIEELSGGTATFTGRTVKLTLRFRDESNRAGCTGLSGSATATVEGGKATIVDRGGQETSSTNVCGTTGAVCLPDTKTFCSPVVVHLDEVPASGIVRLAIKDGTGAWHFEVADPHVAEDAVLVGVPRVGDGSVVDVTCGPESALFREAWLEQPGSMVHHHTADLMVRSTSGNRATLRVIAEAVDGGATPIEVETRLWCTTTRSVTGCPPGFACAVTPEEGLTPDVTLVLR